MVVARKRCPLGVSCKQLAHICGFLGIDARYQHMTLASVNKRSDDGGNLLSSLACPIYHFRGTCAYATMQIRLRETHIHEWRCANTIKCRID